MENTKFSTILSQLFNIRDFNTEVQQKVKFKRHSLILFIIAFLFLFLFKPFTVNETELKYPFLFVCFFHSLSPALITFVYFNTNISFYKTKTDKSTFFKFRWGLSVLLLLFLYGTASFLMRDLLYKNESNWSLHYYLEELRNTYLAGGLIFSYFIFADFYFRNKRKRRHDLEQYPPIQSQIASAKQVISIRTEVKADNFNFEPVQLIFAKADGNYTEITFRTSDGIKKELKRITLRQFELQITEYKFLFRCHRTYLLNISYINSISGNSQNCLVTFTGTTEKVPVSRAKIKMFHDLYQQNKNIN
ncbi:hypothetical protein C1637_08760 [Chryseobacterium lactis]|uniref:LytTR family transcriptional regulator n=2 Tax=Chryseobacterium lactis TaxID=1241981 RepID=A0A3G6RLM4_CHRLC|nr:LytTR family transcriptional regulator [Chryseobacterium lactis]AZB02756.1 LytTR family transcriptional regulator [Chryseobacterium lactis]PNW13950.1 hypothetical protein C1637_08760 [Chryseobacterium lactis]